MLPIHGTLTDEEVIKLATDNVRAYTKRKKKSIYVDVLELYYVYQDIEKCKLYDKVLILEFEKVGYKWYKDGDNYHFYKE